MSEPLFALESEGFVKLMVGGTPGNDCPCCPPGQEHVFAHHFGFAGELQPGARGPLPPDANDLVHALIRKALWRLGTAAAVDRLTIRVRVELVEPSARSGGSAGEEQ